MEEKIMPVDVEAIMKDIRASIAARGGNDTILGFDEAMADKECESGFVANGQYVDSTLHHFVVSSDQTRNIPFYQMIPAGGIKSFVKRFVRKLIAPSMIPIRDAQNIYNDHVVQALYQIEAFTLEKNAILEKQEEDIEKLSQMVRELEKKCETLEKQLSRQN